MGAHDVSIWAGAILLLTASPLAADRAPNKILRLSRYDRIRSPRMESRSVRMRAKCPQPRGSRADPNRHRTQSGSPRRHSALVASELALAAVMALSPVLSPDASRAAVALPEAPSIEALAQLNDGLKTELGETLDVIKSQAPRLAQQAEGVKSSITGTLEGIPSLKMPEVKAPDVGALQQQLQGQVDKAIGQLPQINFNDALSKVQGSLEGKFSEQISTLRSKVEASLPDTQAITEGISDAKTGIDSALGSVKSAGDSALQRARSATDEALSPARTQARQWTQRAMPALEAAKPYVKTAGDTSKQAIEIATPVVREVAARVGMTLGFLFDRTKEFTPRVAQWMAKSFPEMAKGLLRLVVNVVQLATRLIWSLFAKLFPSTAVKVENVLKAIQTSIYNFFLAVAHVVETIKLFFASVTAALQMAAETVARLSQPAVAFVDEKTAPYRRELAVAAGAAALEIGNAIQHKADEVLGKILPGIQLIQNTEERLVVEGKVGALRAAEGILSEASTALGSAKEGVDSELTAVDSELSTLTRN
mmetsp:Transcript_2984/g.5703  ORF Transcript_2984/g.5703 Transcript_2984/m.5703 type:complete len:536 (+) Transcript_2984:3-1610(+)